MKRRALTPEELSILKPMVERQRSFHERVHELEIGIQSVLAAFHGSAVPGLKLEQTPDGALLLVCPEDPE